MEPRDTEQIARKLLEELSITASPECVPVLRSGNNRGSIVIAGKDKFFLKEYFVSNEDTRNRMKHEVEFLEFAEQKKISNLPKILNKDVSLHAALFNYVEGRKITPIEISEAHVEAALELLTEINRFKNTPAAATLSPASESCFSINDHVETIQHRIDRVKQIVPDSAPHQRCVDLVQRTLIPLWEKITLHVKTVASSDRLPLTEWIISPSDFGFHNALLTDDQKLVFFDFEYSGWDDPAKTVSDFFCQPEVSVPRQYRSGFIQKVSSLIENRDLFIARCELLQPLYEMKWVCILLNEFLPDSGRRRRFSARASEEELIQRKLLQLEKVDHIIKTRLSRNT